MKYYKRKLNERNEQLNTLKKGKKMSETHTRKSYGDFDEMFKRVRQKSTSENDRGFSKPKYAAYSNMMTGKKKV